MLTAAYQHPAPRPLSRRTLGLIALLCLALGCWAASITLDYFKHGAEALEADPSARDLAVAAALMFVALDMAAFAIAGLLPAQQLRAQRNKLLAFGWTVILLEVCTICGVQLAITSQADMGQDAVAQRAMDLRDRIRKIEDQAATKLAAAESQRAAAKNAYEALLASRAADKAAALLSTTAPLYEQLAVAEAQKRPTLTGVLGHSYALAYVVARGVLVSVGGLVFFGAAGALMRAASREDEAPAALHRPAAAPAAAAPAPAPSPAPAAQPTGPALTPALSTPALAGTGRLVLAAAAPLAAFAPMPAAQAAPVPFAASVPAAAGASTLTHPAVSTLMHPATALPKQPPREARQGTPAGASTLTHPAAADDAPHAKPKRERRARVTSGSVMDTGTDEHDGARYQRVREGVIAGSIKPSLRGIWKAERASAPTARRYLAELEKEGLIERHGRSFKPTA